MLEVLVTDSLAPESFELFFRQGVLLLISDHPYFLDLSTQLILGRW